MVKECLVLAHSDSERSSKTLVDCDKIQEYTEHKQYRLIEGDKTYIANLGEDYFTYHIAVKL